MKVILAVFLGVCAYGQAATVGAKVEVNGNDMVYTTPDQEIYRIGYLDPGGYMRWQNAQLACVYAGYKGLLSIRDVGAQQAAEYALEAFNVSTGANIWIGLHRETLSAALTWDDGTSLGDFTNWNTKPPSDSLVGGVAIYPVGANVGKWDLYRTDWMHLKCFCES